MQIGKIIDTQKAINIDLKKLLSTRLLIQANSGGGKSWLIRKLLEQSHGKVQQIVIDLEGEFSTLREKYDYLLVGREGEIPANIKTAALLSKKILELNVSTIIDLSELKHHERIIYVKRFIDSLMEAPKKLWHPCLVVVDEAHQFCPQSTKSESASSVIDLMTRGRKRGFCGAIATQRISKLHKDACAEANNRLIGRTGLDVDRKRASEELGFTSKQDERSLRHLDAGQFYAFGPAISQDIIKIKVGTVKTSHPEPGIISEPSPTPKNIQKILKSVIDLPKEAEEELRSNEDMKRKIMELKRQIRILDHQKTTPQIDEKAINAATEKGYKEGAKIAKLGIMDLTKKLNAKLAILDKVRTIIGDKEDIKYDHKLLIARSGHDKKVLPLFKHTPTALNEGRQVVIPDPKVPEAFNQSINKDKTLRKGAMKILGWLAASYPKSLSKQRIATLSGFSVKGGTFNTYISELKRKGWIEGSNNLIATNLGLENVTEQPELPTGEELLDLWSTKFRAGAAKLLRIIYSHYPQSITKQDLGLESDFEPSGGTFNTYISELRRNGLIIIEEDGIKISDEFFN